MSSPQTTPIFCIHNNQNRNKAHIQEAIALLKLEPDFDDRIIYQIQLALMNFQEAVNNVLRNHSINSHWMFVFDSLIRY